MSVNFSLLTVLVFVWGAIAICLIGLVIYRGVVGLNEETELIVDKAESHFVEEQKVISERVERLSKPIQLLSVLAGVLLLVIAGLWVYQGIMTTR
jgi:hypothetical protein